MCEPAIHVLRSVFTRLVQQKLSASVATLTFFFFFFFAYPPSSAKQSRDSQTGWVPSVALKIKPLEISDIGNLKEHDQQVCFTVYGKP